MEIETEIGVKLLKSLLQPTSFSGEIEKKRESKLKKMNEKNDMLSKRNLCIKIENLLLKDITYQDYKKKQEEIERKMEIFKTVKDSFSIYQEIKVPYKGKNKTIFKKDNIFHEFNGKEKKEKIYVEEDQVSDDSIDYSSIPVVNNYLNIGNNL
jgi:hypothetical protein